MRLTRRAALALAGTAGAATLGAARLESVVLADESTMQLEQELTGAATLELTSVEAYDLFIASDVATERTRPTFVTCRDHDRAHAHRLRVALAELGGQLPEAPNPTDVPGLAAVDTESGALDFAIGLEQQAIRSYLTIVRTVSHRALVRTVGSVLASDAQQLAVLRGLADETPVPSAFASGTTP